MSGAGHVPGDIMRLPEPFEYEIELKNRNDVSLLRAFKNPNSLQPYVSDKQILMFNDNGLTLVVMAFIIAIGFFFFLLAFQFDVEPPPNIELLYCII